MRKQKLLIIISITAITCLMFFKIFTSNLYPVPGNLLVTFYFPWYSGGWDGYDPWTTRKALLAADAIKLSYPWKQFLSEEIMRGNVPLWNPHTFSGQPLLANYQSGVFYPFNILYFIFDTKNAWILFIVIQSFLAGLFMYMCSRSFKLNKIASMYSSIVFMFSSAIVIHLEFGNVIHALIWLPFSFWAINSFFIKFKIRYIYLLILGFCLTIFAGFAEASIFIFMASGILFLFKSYEYKLPKAILLLIFALIGALTVSAIQLIPTLEFYKESTLNLDLAKGFFIEQILPVQNLVTLFASDFFGNTASGNLWIKAYEDNTPYFGVVPLIFAIWAVYKLRNKTTIFLSLLVALFTLASIKGPITYLIRELTIPILDSYSSARYMTVAIFGLILLSGFGLNDFLNKIENRYYLNKFLKFTLFIGVIYALLWIFSLVSPMLSSKPEVFANKMEVTRRNLVVPSLIYLSFLFSIFGIAKLRLIENYKTLLIISIVFILTLSGGLYYSNKFLPFSPKSNIFPIHPVITWLQENAGINRFDGTPTAKFDSNFPTTYSTYGAEGYDALRFKRYAELIASSESGEIPDSYLRSEALMSNANQDNNKRLLDILGVKYIIDKDGIISDSDEYQEVWEYEQIKIFERKTALPRFFLTSNYTVLDNDELIIDRIYDPDFDYRNIILEEEPGIQIDAKSSESSISELIYYEANEVRIHSLSDQNSLLFLSDSFDKNWNAYINGQRSKILRANYSFRALPLLAGNNDILMRYEPFSFQIGFYITILSLLILTIFAGVAVRKGKF